MNISARVGRERKELGLMSMYSCPDCGRKLAVGKSQASVLLSCRNCGLSYEARGRGKDEIDAYHELLDNFTSASKSPKFEKQLIKEQISRSLRDIKNEVKLQGIEFEKLPSTVKQILSGKGDYVVKYALLKKDEPEYGCYVEEVGIAENLIRTLRAQGIHRFYRFQEEAIHAILSGENVVIAAPTGYGKTIAFALPIFHSISRSSGIFLDLRPSNRTVQALFMYPTKALNRDQLKVLRALGAKEGITVEVFDGDTPQHERKRILENPSDIIISNLDTVHYHLRNRTSFSRIIPSIRYIVLDEIHEYVGAFGSNTHFILRRLRRVCKNKFQVIGASATIRNPDEFARALFDSPVRLIESKKGRRGRIHFIMLYPSRHSMTTTIVDTLGKLVKAGYKTLVFANTHVNAEVINLAARKGGISTEIHRAGLTGSHRKAVEEAFKSGRLRALVATPTLELGIDIGDLDAVVSMITGITTLTQRIGRAGRKGQDSIAVLALRNDDPISSYYKKHPDIYFTDIDPAYVEPMNPVVARFQLLSASMDSPLTEREFAEFQDVLTSLEKEGLLNRQGHFLTPSNRAWRELVRYSIRGIGETVAIVDRDSTIGERQMPMAARELFPEAVYLHGGKKYQSRSFVFKGGVGKAEVERLDDNYPYKTEALRYSEPKILEVLEKKKVLGVEVLYCKLNITEVVHGYVAKEIFSEKIANKHSLAEPIRYSFDTRGLVFKAPESTATLKSMLRDFDIGNPILIEKYRDEEELSEDASAGSFHAVEHVLIHGSDMLTGGGSTEMGGISMGTSGVIFAYDGCPGGSGVTKLLYDRLQEAFNRAQSILKECNCRTLDGCPMCTYSYQCGNNNKPLLKAGAIESLQRILRASRTRVKEEDYRGSRAYV